MGDESRGSDRTSEYLKSCLNSREDDQEAPFGTADHNRAAAAQEGEAIVRGLQMMLLQSYETIGDETPRVALDALREHGDACEWLLDDYLVKMLLDRVPKMVARLTRFGTITVPVLPNADVNGYLREAVRAYLFGLNQAAVALARSALESGLRSRIPTALEQHWSLEQLISAASQFRVLEAAQLQLASEVRRSGNAVLHGSPCDDQFAFDILVKVRAVLEGLFSKA